MGEGEDSDMARSQQRKQLSLTLIAAMTRANGIGVNGGLPWRLSKEMAHFRRATSVTGEPAASSGAKRERRNAVIMGRKTWESIPGKFRPLKGRINVVISSKAGKSAREALGIKEAEDSHLFSSLPEAVDFLSALRSDRLARTFVIGGAQLYRQTMNEYPAAASSSSSSSQAASKAVVDRLLVTRIASPAFDECDVFFPEFRTETQKAHEEGDESQLVDGELRGQGWTRASQNVLESFLSEPDETAAGEAKVERGIVEEKGVRYALQLWQRS